MQNTMKVENKTTMLVVTAMMMCIIMLLTILIRIPSPTTKGYINIGDAAIFMSVLMLGWKYGAVAAGVGAAMADAIGGYMYFAPWTLGIKALMAIVMGLIISKALASDRSPASQRGFEIFGMAAGGLVMVTGYYFAEVIMYGSWVVPLIEIPLNCTQFAVSMVLAVLLSNALFRTSLGSKFAYTITPAERKKDRAA